jgi:hypothetical protein
VLVCKSVLVGLCEIVGVGFCVVDPFEVNVRLVSVFVSSSRDLVKIDV